MGALGGASPAAGPSAGSFGGGGLGGGGLGGGGRGAIGFGAAISAGGEAGGAAGGAAGGGAPMPTPIIVRFTGRAGSAGPTLPSAFTWKCVLQPGQRIRIPAAGM
ncbi:MAG: hypothetical protein OEY14_05270, partial [Myxococcales bacterium]|nr:hypothetical protein [Myxococcales bacterium]